MLIILSIFGATAVILGAFGAHFLKERLSTAVLQTYQTGVEYHFYHTAALGLTLLLHLYHRSPWLSRAFWAFVVGILLFSGSLYILSTRDLLGITSYKWLGPLTPIGGVCFIFGWISILISAITKREDTDAEKL